MVRPIHKGNLEYIRLKMYKFIDFLKVPIVVIYYLSYFSSIKKNSVKNFQKILDQIQKNFRQKSRFGAFSLFLSFSFYLRKVSIFTFSLFIYNTRTKQTIKINFFHNFHLDDVESFRLIPNLTIYSIRPQMKLNTVSNKHTHEKKFRE